eukprot:CAMPEP_0114484906 /NCGR_PEP_ID=MMETSP0104-20121206/19668_1 /TAXON_ID=37642 ORGANISM="Paraphysomonas imperforata, Strain PA2" /NCGR_SAMPLE_ID=MMETSP0104 /ASSEMBLY_ACC=CAM_ASM_000202 /LENGTH=41 /DNA_ID= /DNA_START= /DNA_END= /DNA_ORIENTATION=
MRRVELSTIAWPRMTGTALFIEKGFFSMLLRASTMPEADKV